MAEGFVLDANQSSVAVSKWVEGAPEKSAWTGLKLSGRGRSEIATWRCNRCGFLEQYAVATPDRSEETAQRNQIMVLVAILAAVLLVVLGVLLLLR
jgi:hypothetical protein